MATKPLHAALALSRSIFALPAAAQDSADQLFGSWRRLSFKAQIIGEDAAPCLRAPHFDAGAHDDGVSIAA